MARPGSGYGRVQRVGPADEWRARDIRSRHRDALELLLLEEVLDLDASTLNA
jgi:hypothetical protein